jgi:hypothetical protein
MSSFEVGQILFLLPKKENKIIPVRVVEVVVRKKLNEQSVEYMVEIPNRTRDIVSLSELEAMSFTSEHELRDYMIQNSTNAIEQMIASAKRHSVGAFGEVEASLATSREPAQVEEYTFITLPDGTRARVRNESNFS